MLAGPTPLVVHVPGTQELDERPPRQRRGDLDVRVRLDVAGRRRCEGHQQKRLNGPTLECLLEISVQVNRV